MTFDCFYHSDTHPTIAWAKIIPFYKIKKTNFTFNSELEDLERYKTISLQSDDGNVLPQTMHLRNLSVSSSGHYVCVVGNLLGNVRKNFYLTVGEKPSLTRNTVTTTTKSPLTGPPRWKYLNKMIGYTTEYIGDDSQFMCTAVGVPPLNVTWYKDGILFTPNMRNYSLHLNLAKCI